MEHWLFILFAIKGICLWYAGRYNHKIAFIVLLVTSFYAIPEIIYLIWLKLFFKPCYCPYTYEPVSPNGKFSGWRCPECKFLPKLVLYDLGPKSKVACHGGKKAVDLYRERSK